MRQYPFHQILFVVTLLLSKTSARIGGATNPWWEEHQPAQLRSLEDLSQNVVDELLVLHEQGVLASLQVPQITRRIHRIIVEGSAEADEPFHNEARRRALSALRSATDSIFTNNNKNESQSLIMQQHGGTLRHNLEANNDVRQLVSDSATGKIALGALIVFFVVVAVGNLVNADTDGTEWPYIRSDNSFITASLGDTFKSISPCHRLPLQADATYGYLPITNGFAESTLDLIDGTNVVKWFETIFNPEDLNTKENEPPDESNCSADGEICEFSADCCKKVDVVVNCNEVSQRCERGQPGTEGFVVEPFCLLWSETTNGKFIDTLAFSPLNFWPPIQPLPKAPSILPKCPPKGSVRGCQHCEFVMGFPITDFTIHPMVYKLLFQFSGIAFSWADNAKLTFGTNRGTSDIKIWDGFREQPLPPIPDMNFWLSFRLEIVPLPTWQVRKRFCETGVDKKEALKSVYKLSLIMDFELYVAFDKQTDKDAAGNQLSTDLLGPTQEPDVLEEKKKKGPGRRRRKKDFIDGDEMWRSLQSSSTSEDPCVIITMTEMRLTMPSVGSLVFGQAVGGFCNFSPEETGVQCTPNGFFYNIEQQFRIEGGPVGVLGTIFDSEEVETPIQDSGNSLGIFQNPDGENEAVVFRLEYPARKLFGVSLGSPRPKVHFQVVKGSEVQRRRETLLRKRRRNSPSSDWGKWVANCANVESDCSPNGWAPFFKNNNDANNPNLLEQTQICSDILLNDDKLLYYNRIIAADTVDDDLKYVIRPPSGTEFKVAAKYNYESNPDSNIVILFLAIADIGNIVISIREISVSLVISEGTPPSLIPENDSRVATQLYNNIADEFKEENGGLWRPPNPYNFPSVAKYEEYLPPAGKEFEELDESGALERAELFNERTEENEADRLGVFVRLFCNLEVLFFVNIYIGLIMENFGDGKDPNSWIVVGQFGVDLLGLRYSVAVSTMFNFNSRRYRHLEGEEYSRALATNGLESANYDVDMSVSCVPDSFCEAITQFFEDVGEAIWEGMQAIGSFFAEDVAGFIDDAINVIGEWGEKFVGELVTFAKDVAEDIVNVFRNGEVAELLDSGVEAFNEEAKKSVDTLSDGKFSLDDVLAVGDLVLATGKIVGDFIVAGVKDIVDAIGAFFDNVGDAIKDWLGMGDPWDELRHPQNYASLSCLTACRNTMTNNPVDQDQLKKDCWCTDEFECPVKIPQKRRCRKKSYFFYVETKCSGWSTVPVKKGNGYPRFDGRKFDKACRVERMTALAKAERYHKEAVQTSSLIDANFGSNFKGLSNFSPSARRRRSLQDGVDSVTSVNELNITDFKATIGGKPGRVSVRGVYDGAQLKSDRTDVDTLESGITADFDFSDYQYPSLNIGTPNGEGIKRATQQAAAVPYLGALKTDDPVFLSKQPIIEAPKLTIVGKAGTSQNPIILQCADGNIASAWLDKLDSFEPETLRRNRRRRLSSEPIKETLVEFVVENILKEKIMNEDGIKLLAETGNVIDGGSKQDVFSGAKALLGTEGAGSFMNPNNVAARRRRQGTSLSRYKLELSVMEANPLCDRFQWTFEATISDPSGKSNPVFIDAVLFFGPSELQTAPPSSVQTRCDSTLYGVEDLEENKALLNFTGYNTFKPSLKVDNCPSPFIYISAENMDIVINEGEPCTTNYKVVQREWSLFSHENACPPPSLQNPFFLQTITLGGFFDTDRGIEEPATPVFELQNKNYYLPNEPRAEVGTNVTDFFRNGVAPTSECGLCSDPTKAIVHSHPENFVCSEEGENVISVKVLNQIGVEMERQAIARVFDDTPPNMATKSHTVYLNQFGWLDEADKVTVADIDAFTWDNCGIKEMYVTPTPLYQCGDEGPQTVNLVAIDTSKQDGGNMNSREQAIIVDDSKRRGIGDDEYLSLKKSTKKFAKDYLKEEFDYDDCKEVGVYVRPKGQRNFAPLDYSSIEDFEGFLGEDDWDVPKLDICDDESVLFHSAICQTDDESEFIGCEGEIKAEVLCREGKKQSKKRNTIRKQTCYRAKVITDGGKSQGIKRCKNEKNGKRKIDKGSSSQRRRRRKPRPDTETE